MWFIQLVEAAESPAEAQQMLDALRLQVGFRGGRVLPKSHDGRPDRVQAFFDDEPNMNMEPWLPEGLRRVIVPDGQRKALGIF